MTEAGISHLDLNDFIGRVSCRHLFEMLEHVLHDDQDPIPGLLARLGQRGVPRFMQQRLERRPLEERQRFTLQRVLAPPFFKIDSSLYLSLSVVFRDEGSAEVQEHTPKHAETPTPLREQLPNQPN